MRIWGGCVFKVLSMEKVVNTWLVGSIFPNCTPGALRQRTRIILYLETPGLRSHGTLFVSGGHIFSWRALTWKVGNLTGAPSQPRPTRRWLWEGQFFLLYLNSFLLEQIVIKYQRWKDPQKSPVPPHSLPLNYRWDTKWKDTCSRSQGRGAARTRLGPHMVYVIDHNLLPSTAAKSKHNLSAVESKGNTRWDFYTHITYTYTHKHTW